MTQKHFRLLADKIRENNQNPDNRQFLASHIGVLMQVCMQANPKFNPIKFTRRVYGK